MSRLEHYIADVLGAAEQHPEQSAAIFREAARRLNVDAQSPGNRRYMDQLSQAASFFARAAERPDSISDFRDLLQETAAAYNEVGAPESDDLAVVARRREIHEERTPGLPRVSITPKSVNEGTRLGDMATLKWQPTADDLRRDIRQQNTVVFWQGRKEEAQAVTVDVGLLDLPPEANVGAGPRAYGLVTYGSDGAKTDVKFDVGLGTRFTVVGNYVSVLVALNPPRADFTKGQITVCASIGFFAAPSLAPVIYTEYVDGLSNVAPDNVSRLIRRPAKAMQLLPMQSSLAAGTARIEFLSLDAFTARSVVTWTNSAQNIPIPLAGDVVWIRVTNTGGGAADFQLPFQLAL